MALKVKKNRFFGLLKIAQRVDNTAQIMSPIIWKKLVKITLVSTYSAFLSVFINLVPS